MSAFVGMEKVDVKLLVHPSTQDVAVCRIDVRTDIRREHAPPHVCGGIQNTRIHQKLIHDALVAAIDLRLLIFLPLSNHIPDGFPELDHLLVTPKGHEANVYLHAIVVVSLEYHVQQLPALHLK